MVVSVYQPGSFHNGGDITFGPADGMLYMSLGDGASSGYDPLAVVQDRSSVLGKVLRIDVDDDTFQCRGGVIHGNYGIPEDNPFVDDDSYAPEIFALGLRSPFRCSFDRLNMGGLYH